MKTCTPWSKRVFQLFALSVVTLASACQFDARAGQSDLDSGGPDVLDGSGLDDGGITLDANAMVDAQVFSNCADFVVPGDTFSDGTFSPQWVVEASTDVSVREEAGQLQMTLATGNGYVGGAYRTTQTFSLEGRRFFIEVAELPASGTHYRIVYGLAVYHYTVDIAGGQILFTRKPSGAGVETLASIPYIPGQHRYLQLREQSGTLFAEAAETPDDWFQIGSYALDDEDKRAAIISGYVWLQSYTESSNENPGVAAFDNLNVGSNCAQE